MNEKAEAVLNAPISFGQRNRSPRTHLVVRADDIGASQSVNTALESCFHRGVVRNASVMAVGPALEDAAERLARCPGMCVGFHITLNSEWSFPRLKPVLPAEKVPSLVDADGFLLPHPDDLERRGFCSDQAIMEIVAQLHRLRSVGLQPRYIDDHMGVRRLDGLMPWLSEFAIDQGLILVDQLAERFPHDVKAEELNLAERWLYHLGNSPPGRYEIVTHPIDQVNHARLIETPKEVSERFMRQRLAERDALIDPRVVAACAKPAICLTRYDHLENDTEEPVPQYVWDDHLSKVRPDSEWVVFSRTFELGSDVVSARMHLFASHRYRLRVNGRVIGSGPARYVPGHEEFDTYPLEEVLRPGKNVITVEVCFSRIPDYQTMPGDIGRFIAWGNIRTASCEVVDLMTPGKWLGWRDQSRITPTPRFSFAIGPVEVCDPRQSPLSGFQPPDSGAAQYFPVAPILNQDGVMRLEPRSIPAPSAEPVVPELKWACRLRDDETRFGYLSSRGCKTDISLEALRRHASRYECYIHSPVRQNVTIGTHWGEHSLNGLALTFHDDPCRGNRQNAEATLNSGWNKLCGEFDQLRECYPCILALPGDAGLTIRGRPSMDARSVMRHSLPAERLESCSSPANSPASGAAQGEPDESWIHVPRGVVPTAPARLMSWDRLDERERTASSALPAPIMPNTSKTFLFDFGHEYLGHVELELDAPQGAIVDLAYDERLRADGCLGFFETNPWTDTADRVIWSGGRGCFETFHPRGGRYLQITVRMPADSSTTGHLYRVQLRDSRCLPRITGAFESGDALWDWTWRVGVETLNASIEDAFCDSPWRERGAYLADSYVQSMTCLTLSSDRSLVRRALMLFAQGQRDDGQMSCACPASLRVPHADFTLLYPIWLRDYWARTGDTDILKMGATATEGIFKSKTWIRSKHSVLWNASRANRMFIDWGATESARYLDENGVLNAFRYRALQASADVLRALGRSSLASRYLDEATEVKQALVDRLWLKSKGYFAPGSIDGQPINESMIHVNILALAFGIVDDDKQPQLIQWVCRRLENNATQAVNGKRGGNFAELYFLKYGLEAMVKINRFDLAEHMIERHMQVMKRNNAWTLWETLHKGVSGLASLCHSWSCSPIEYISRYVLGVREVKPGHTGEYIVDPCCTRFTRVRGVVPHPLGDIHVEWVRQEDGSIKTSVSGPPAIRLHTGNVPPPAHD